NLISKTGSGISVVLERVGSTRGVNVVGAVSEMMEKEPSGQRVRDRVNEEDTAMMLYSSGTTGPSKGVITSHRNLTASVARFVSEKRIGGQVFLCTVPMFHTYGLLCFTMFTVAVGSTVVILRRFDLHGMMAAVEKYSATILALAPPVVVAMTNEADVIRARYDLSSLRTVRCGGAPLSKEVTEGFMEKYPTVDILAGYALTESNGAGASIDTVEESRRYGSVGLLAPGVEARIVDPDTGRVMGVNQTGELWLRGPSISKEGFLEKYPTVNIFQAYALTESNGGGAFIDTVEDSQRFGTSGLLTSDVEARIVDPHTGRFLGINQTGELWLKGPTIAKVHITTCFVSFLQGYFKNQEATNETINAEGWLKTGDLCYIDEDGFVFVVDRLKELIKYKGYQVPPAELEALLITHPDILDAAVIPFPDKEAGQYPMAYVTRKVESNLSEKQVIEFISKQVYSVITIYFVVVIIKS
ncbi:hypothetical protein F2Q68_00035439, partial [Brassica cretica]